MQVLERRQQLIADLHLEAEAAGPVLGDADAEEARQSALLLVGALQALGDALVVVLELRMSLLPQRWLPFVAPVPLPGGGLVEGPLIGRGIMRIVRSNGYSASVAKP